jgi:hypothetical protein
MTFIKQYKEILKPEIRVSRNDIRPRNIYRISTYKGSDPITKTGEETRLVFVIGKIGTDRIHCIKLNDIRPIYFTQFINKLRDKRIPIPPNPRLEDILKTFSKDGKLLFETYIKRNPKIYSPILSNYRVYLLKDIVNVYEIRFEDEMLQKMFGEGSNTTKQRNVIQDEINQRDGGIATTQTNDTQGQNIQ